MAEGYGTARAGGRRFREQGPSWPRPALIAPPVAGVNLPTQLQALPEPAILHVRLPDFAVAVAVARRPELAGQPLIVGGDALGRGAVWAASPEARARGVRPGMPLRTAAGHCPRALVLPVDAEPLLVAAREVLALLGAFTPLVEPDPPLPAPGYGSVRPDAEIGGRRASRPDTKMSWQGPDTETLGASGVPPPDTEVSWQEPHIEVSGVAPGAGHAKRAQSTLDATGVGSGAEGGGAGRSSPARVGRGAGGGAGHGSTTVLRRLAGCFGAYLDVRGCERLFGPAGSMARQIEAELAAYGYTVQIGIATNPDLAAVASALASPGSPRLVEVGGEAAFLAGLDLGGEVGAAALLDLDPDLVAHLRAVGFSRAGDLAAIPSTALRLRFGAAGMAAHTRATGTSARPVVPPPSAETVKRSCRLEDPTGDGERLARELGRLAGELAAALAGRQQAACTLTLTMRLAADEPPSGPRQLSLFSPPAPDQHPQMVARASDHLWSCSSPGTLWVPSGSGPTARCGRRGGSVYSSHSQTPRSNDERSFSRTLHLKAPVAGEQALVARAGELLAQVLRQAGAGPGRARPLLVEGLSLRAGALRAAGVQMALPLLDLPGGGTSGAVERLAQQLRARFGPRAARRVRIVEDALLPEERVIWEDAGCRPPPGARIALDVQLDAWDRPASIRRGQGAWEPVRTICSQWRLRTRWWMDPTHRHYYLLETARGAVLELYQELSDGSWHLVHRRD